MTFAKLSKDVSPARASAGWLRRCVFATSLLASAACDSRNLAFISLTGMPSSATLITAYYRLDGGDWKAVVPRRSVQELGIELPGGRSAALETQIHGYTNNIPCSLGSASGAVDLTGGSIRELTLDVTPTTEHCTGAGEPVDFPQGKLALWANAPYDIWIAGAGGKILQGNSEPPMCTYTNTEGDMMKAARSSHRVL
jgi:hypothetical protein